MKTIFTCILFAWSFSAQAQFGNVRSTEVFVGSNVTRPFSSSIPFNQLEIVPDLGWQVGGMFSFGKLDSKKRIRTGLIFINRQFHTNSVRFGPFDGGNGWVLGNKRSVYLDFEVPLLFMRTFAVNSANSLSPSFGVIPGWRISEFYRFKQDFLNSDGTQILVHTVLRSRFNHKSPFNRLNVYASIQWQHTYGSGRTVTIEPNFRFNVLPFFENTILSGPEDETISFGLNVGVLLNRKLKPRER